MRWLSIFFLLLATGLAQAAYTPAVDVRASGADPSGNNDATAAFNKCLTQAGSGGTCYAGGGKFKLLGNVTIPANTTLACGDNLPDQEDAPASYGTASRIMLDSTHTISAAGQAAKITGCLIVRNGMAFPAVDSSAYAGTAVFGDVGSGNFQITNTVVIGFDVCIHVKATRPIIDTVYLDCNGATAGGGALWVDNGNTDSGYITRLKMQPLGNANIGTCVQITRAGVGLRNDGINYYGDITVQNFRQIDVYNTSYMVAEKIWTDFPVACQATYPASIGLQDESILRTGELNLNSSGVGLVSKSFETIDHLFLNQIGGDCVKLGVGGTVASLNIRVFEVNNGSACGHNGAGFAVNFDPSAAANSSLSILSGTIANVASTPYLNIPNTMMSQRVSVSDKILTDLANPSTLYGTTTITNCVGLGTGTCVLGTSQRTTPWRGVVTLNAAGTPATFGSFHLNFPLSVPDSGGCLATLGNGSALWPPAATVYTAGVSGAPEVQAVIWNTNGAVLTAGSNYTVNFQCEGQ